MTGPVNVEKITVHQLADIEVATDLYEEEDDDQSKCNSDDSNSCQSHDLSDPQRNDNILVGNLSKILDTHYSSDDDSSDSSTQSQDTGIQHLK